MIEISHTYRTGTIVTGTSKGSVASEILRRHGLRWSHNIGDDGAWYVRRSREKPANRALIELARVELADAGYDVQVTIDDTPQPEEAESDRHARVEARVESYEQAANRAEQAGQARLDKVKRSRAQIPPGQPITSGRFAAYLSRLARSEQIGRRHLGRAERYRGRAHAAAVTQVYRHSPSVMLRRIERLEIEIRRVGRQIAGLDSDPYYLQNPQMRGPVEQRLTGRKQAMEAQLSYWRGELDTMIRTGTYRPWKPRHFRLGDEVCISASAVRWLTVVRVNRKSLTVSLPHETPTAANAEEGERAQPEGLTVRVSYDQVWALRRDGVVHDRQSVEEPQPDRPGTASLDASDADADPDTAQRDRTRDEAEETAAEGKT